jgi:hypothetical protein
MSSLGSTPSIEVKFIVVHGEAISIDSAKIEVCVVYKCYAKPLRIPKTHYPFQLPTVNPIVVSMWRGCGIHHALGGRYPFV